MDKRKALVLVGVLLLVALIAALVWWLLSNKDQVGEVAGEMNQTPKSVVILKIFTPQVEVLVPGDSDWRAGVDLEELLAGTRIRTDAAGRAEVRFPGGTVTRLDHNSEILMETVQEAEQKYGVELLKGKIWSRVSRVLGKITYETRTARTVATVRGTEYGHEIFDDFDRVVVAESQVEVVCVDGVDNEMLVGDVTVTEWNCGGQEPESEESSIDELIEDEWYKFNLYDEGAWGEEEGGVLGVVDVATPTPAPRAVRPPLIECKGPDGKIARSTQEDCDNLWKYWNANPPPPAPTDNSGGSSNGGGGTPTPSVRQSQIAVTGADCADNGGCTKIRMYGSGFDVAQVVQIEDVFGNFHPGTVNAGTSDSSNMSVDFDPTLTYGFYLCENDQFGLLVPSSFTPVVIHVSDGVNSATKSYFPTNCGGAVSF